MNPYRTSSPAAAIDAASAQPVRPSHDLGCMGMFAVGALVAMSGMVLADGTELAAGGLTLMAGLARARRIHRESLMNSSLFRLGRKTPEVKDGLRFHWPDRRAVRGNARIDPTLRVGLKERP